jgi:four helix bundle protein
VQHLSIVRGSLMELETHLILASRLAYLDAAGTSRLLERTAEVSRMLSGLTRSLKT